MAKRKKIIIITSIIVAVLLIDLTITGFLKFGYNVVRCGGMPVAIRKPGFGVGAPSYWLPGRYTPGGAGTTYFCSEGEAVEAGYRRNPLQGD